MARVLIIDDDKMFRHLLKRWLNLAGHDVEEAETGKEGMNKCHVMRPDVVITDIFMPDADGIEMTLDAVQSQCARGIIVISGGGRTIDGLHFLDYAKRFGAFAAFQKPLEREKLLQAVDAIMAE